MSLPETQDLGIRCCPGCEPERDPTREILVAAWCADHAPGSVGLDDERVRLDTVHTGANEAVGESCRAIAEALREAEAHTRG